MDLLTKTVKHNPNLIKAAASFHQSGQIPPDTYVIDLDMVRINAEKIAKETAKFHLEAYVTAKQFGRNPLVCRAITNAGLTKTIAMDIEGAKNLHRHGFPIGHIGHFGQIPTSEIKYVLEKMRPEVITVFSFEKAQQISKVAGDLKITQRLLIKVIADKRLELMPLGGGYTEDEVFGQAKRIQELENVRIVGVTTYPAFSFSLLNKTHEATSNFNAMVRVANKFEKELGIKVEQINAPGRNSVKTMQLAAEKGATHVEPGHAFIGTLPEHAFLDDSPELPAVTYVTEISHFFAGHALAFGDSYMTTNGIANLRNDIMYEYLYACIGNDPDQILDTLVPARPQQWWHEDLGWFSYCNLMPKLNRNFKVGDTVVFGFRPQIYRTPKGRVAVISGIQNGKPKLLGLFDRAGVMIDREEDGPIGYSKDKTLQIMDTLR